MPIFYFIGQLPLNRRKRSVQMKWFMCPFLQIVMMWRRVEVVLCRTEKRKAKGIVPSIGQKMQ
jgi:hypothetical protein